MMNLHYPKVTVMSSASLILYLFTWALAGLIPAARAEKPGPFSVSYTHAGLTEITVKDGKLHYIWHTDRKWDDGKAAPDRSQNTRSLGPGTVRPRSPLARRSAS